MTVQKWYYWGFALCPLLLSSIWWRAVSCFARNCKNKKNLQYLFIIGFCRQAWHKLQNVIWQWLRNTRSAEWLPLIIRSALTFIEHLLARVWLDFRYRKKLKTFHWWNNPVIIHCYLCDFMVAVTLKLFCNIWNWKKSVHMLLFRVFTYLCQLKRKEIVLDLF